MATQSPEATKKKFYEAGEKLEDISKNIGEHTGKMVQQMSGKANEYYRYGRQYVQDNPVKGIAAAAATGAVVGSLLTFVLRSKN